MNYLTSYNILGLLLILLGTLLFFFPPKKINSTYGYKTPSSMSSQKKWDCAQRYSGKLMFFHGLILSIGNLLSQKAGISEAMQHLVGVTLLFSGFGGLFFLVERKLKNQ